MAIMLIFFIAKIFTKALIDRPNNNDGNDDNENNNNSSNNSKNCCRKCNGRNHD